ncbi:MAG: hypothetical protein AAGH40_02260 [Verrucomicrobiota bacterium]
MNTQTHPKYTARKHRSRLCRVPRDERGLPELEILSALRPGESHSAVTLSAVSGLSVGTIRRIEARALAKVREAPEMRRLLLEFREPSQWPAA